MGLSASQARYLTLTARQSDLEYQAQVINQARIDLANKSTAAARAYTEGMANKVIRTAFLDNSTSGTTTKFWKELTFSNLVSQGYQIIGPYGKSLSPSPYTEYTAGSVLSETDYRKLVVSHPELVGDGRITKVDGGYAINQTMRFESDPNYNGMDIQSLLVSGTGHVVTQAFFDYLCEHGYGSGGYYNLVEDGKDPEGNIKYKKEETTYEKLVDEWQQPTIVDWRSDITNMFKQDYYTEDDAAVNAEYEATTAEIQATDKKLELQLKQIETEHKAIQTEMEAVKKVIDKNIENTYKTFG